MEHFRCGDEKREGLVIRWMAWAVAAFFKPKSLLVAEKQLSQESFRCDHDGWRFCAVAADNGQGVR
jgi:hypothetical protein